MVDVSGLIPAATSDSFLSHWKDLIVIWLVFNFISAMPAPGTSGPTSSWVYKWLFGALNGIKGSGGRVLAVIFPESAITKMLPSVTNTPPDAKA